VTPLAWEDNLEFWRVLHSVIDAEPAIEELRPVRGVLAELGIEAERFFQPDQAPSGLLTEVARVGRDQMLVSAFASYRSDRLAWPDRTWEWVGLRPENGDFERPSSLDVEARDRRGTGSFLTGRLVEGLSPTWCRRDWLFSAIELDFFQEDVALYLFQSFAFCPIHIFVDQFLSQLGTRYRSERMGSILVGPDLDGVLVFHVGRNGSPRRPHYASTDRQLCE
jgi:hypothetical protein